MTLRAPNRHPPRSPLALAAWPLLAACAAQTPGAPTGSLGGDGGADAGGDGGGDGGGSESVPGGEDPWADALPPRIEGDSEDFYADGALPALAVELSEESVSDLLLEPREWVPAWLRWEGSLYGPIGLRVKGENSFRPFDEKPSLHLRFDEYDDDGRFLGLRRVVLNNMIDDDSQLRERLAYGVFRALGAPASRCNHATLTVNGADYGLYANVENVDEELLGRWFEDDEGSMWEIHDADFRPGLLEGFELEEGEDDRSTLEALTALLEQEDGIQGFGAYVEEDPWFRYFAVMGWIGNLDGYPFSDPGDDAHVYREPASERLHFLPHGLDEAFFDDASVEYVMHGILATACIEDAACKARWREELRAVMDAGDALDLSSRIDEIAAEIAGSVAADPRREWSAEEVETGQETVRAFVAAQRANLEEQLEWD
jgi:hypothetical protein